MATGPWASSRTEGRLREILIGVDQNLVVCGDTHAQFDRRVGAKSDRILQFLISKGLHGCPVCSQGRFSVGPEHVIISTPDTAEDAPTLSAGDEWRRGRGRGCASRAI